MINYGLILQINYPGTQWVLSGNSYDGLEWLDETPKPTQEDLDALWPSTQEYEAKNNCKTKASLLLQQTDWTTIPDVADPAVSNPYLMNSSEFAAYRSQVRALAVNPVVDPVWPVIPTSQWSS